MGIATTLVVAMLFSCENDFDKIKGLNKPQKFPAGIAENFKMTYTEAGFIKAVLESPMNQNFSNQKFPYQEFPKGLKVDFFDANNNKSTVTADYGIYYRNTDLISLEGNVVLKTHDGRELHAAQLYWDQKNEWIFTEKNYIYTSEDLNMAGVGIDFNKEFTKVFSHKNSGSAIIEDK